MKRTEGTYNRADPTAWVKYENKWLTIKHITWGLNWELRLFGRRFSGYEPWVDKQFDKKFHLQPFTRIFDVLEDRRYKEEQERYMREELY